MSQESIIELFQTISGASKRFVNELVQDSFEVLGRECSLGLLEEWKILGNALNTPCKLSCLRDRNHRLLILEYLRVEAASYYKNSYFNHAKIDPEYLKYMKLVGPYEFTEILTIVNKLKLIEKHHRFKMEAKIVSENHIEEKIRKIIEICCSEKRTVNSTLNKFKAIVEFEDRIELIKELGKLLRHSWSEEKKNNKNEANTLEEAKPDLTGEEKESMSEFKQYFKEAESKDGSDAFFYSFSLFDSLFN